MEREKQNKIKKEIQGCHLHSQIIQISSLHYKFFEKHLLKDKEKKIVKMGERSNFDGIPTVQENPLPRNPIASDSSSNPIGPDTAFEAPPRYTSLRLRGAGAQGIV